MSGLIPPGATVLASTQVRSGSAKQRAKQRAKQKISDRAAEGTENLLLHCAETRRDKSRQAATACDLSVISVDV